jgi:two-component system OmpR family sensor kinase
MRSEANIDGGRIADATRLIDGAVLRGGAAVAAATLAVAVVTRQLVAVTVDPNDLAVVASSMAVALMYALTLVSFLWWRLAADRRSLYLSAACFCYATFPLLLGVVVPTVVDSSDIDGVSVAFQLAGAPAIVVFGLAARRAGTRAVRNARSVLTLLMLATLSIAALLLALPWARAVELTPEAPHHLAARLILGALAVVWVVVALAHAVAARRHARRLVWTWPVAAAGIGLAYAIDAVPGQWSAGAAWLGMTAALVAGLCGAMVELERYHAAERHDLRDALVQAAIARSHAQAIDDSRAELRHDAGAALLGIEAAVRGLSRHRDLLTIAQWNALSNGLVAEVHRLGSLLGDCTDDGSSFDLRDVIMPVITCARARGLEINTAVPAGIGIEGSRERTAHALLALLDNARRHAPGSPVDVRAIVGDDDATLYVDDRGRGVPHDLRGSLFERGVRAPTSDGSGLGLFVAWRLVSEVGGSLWFEPRAGGGSSFAMRLRRAGRAGLVGTAPGTALA